MIDLTLSIRIPQGGRIAPVNPERDMPVIMAALEKEIRERLTQGIDAPGKILRINLAWEDIGAGEKSETEVKVPEGMLKAAMKPFGWHPDRYEAHLGAFFEGVCVRDILEAALLWQRENAPEPTNAQAEELSQFFSDSTGMYRLEIQRRCKEWVRRMYDDPKERLAVK